MVFVCQDICQLTTPRHATHISSFDRDFPPPVLRHVASLLRADAFWRVFASSRLSSCWRSLFGCQWWDAHVVEEQASPVRVIGRDAQHLHFQQVLHGRFASSAVSSTRFQQTSCAPAGTSLAKQARHEIPFFFFLGILLAADAFSFFVGSRKTDWRASSSPIPSLPPNRFRAASPMGKTRPQST